VNKPQKLSGAANEEDPEKVSLNLPAPADILTAFEIIRRRNRQYDPPDFQFDLTGANLTGANLTGAHLGIVNFTNADLSRADLRDENLRSANLTGAKLTGATLFRIDLSFADLRGADLSGAKLAGADLSSADLSEAKGVNFTQLSEADIDGYTRLPAYLMSQRDVLIEISSRKLR
jgi:uncharacterized protein YjbI with pentapeptide repeats